MFRSLIDRIPRAQLVSEREFDNGASYLLRVGAFAPFFVRVWYLKTALVEEEIKVLLDNLDVALLTDDGEIQDCYTLFVVDGYLLGSEYTDGALVETPRWLQVLHGLNFGKVYVWHDYNIAPIVLHLQWTANGAERQVSWYTQLFDLDLDVRRSDSWVHGFDGVYRTAYFPAVPNWWTETPPDFQEAMNAARERFRQETENLYEQLRRQQATPSPTGDTVDPARFAFSGRMDRTTACRILGVPRQADRIQIKAVYTTLAKQFHPDLNPDPRATTWMQAINAAYAYLTE